MSLSLGIIVYDAQRHMLTNVILLCILCMVCIKNKYSNNIDAERKKERKAPFIIIYYTKIINSPIPTKVKLGTS